MFDIGQTAGLCSRIKSMSEESKKCDRRTSRTRRSLSDALIELILEKPYDAITVQNVLDRADVGRSTFYSHYRDKEDLFLSDWEGLLDGVNRHIEWGNAKGERFVPVQELFRHVQEAHHFYRALARSRKTDLLFKTGPDYLARSIEAKLTSLLADKPHPPVPVPVLSNYLAGEIFNLLKWWLDHNMPYPPERMDQIFHELVMPAFRSVLESIGADSK
jgi:AcrR family transcriptional regulator